MPPYQFNITPKQLEEDVDKNLRVTEVWVAWEPIVTLRDTISLNQVVKHVFLVFVLEPGQTLWDDGVWTEYKYLRVERQQLVDHDQEAGGSAAAPAEALLNLRFCRDPVQVLGLDIPGVDVEKLKKDDLEQHGIQQPPNQRVKINLPVTSGHVITNILSTHRWRPVYNVADENCIWLVGYIVGGLGEKVDELTQEIAEAHEEEERDNNLFVNLGCWMRDGVRTAVCNSPLDDWIDVEEIREKELRKIAHRMGYSDLEDMKKLFIAARKHPTFALSQVYKAGNKLVNGWFEDGVKSVQAKSAVSKAYAAKSKALVPRNGVAVATDLAFVGSG